MRRWVGHFLWRLFWRKTPCRCSVLLLGFSGKLTSFFTFMGLSLSSVFPAGCFSPHLADINVYMIVKSAQICILCEMCAELLICCCVVSQKWSASVSAGPSGLEHFVRFLWADVMTVQVYATEDLGCIIKENSFKKKSSLYPAEVSEGHCCLNQWSDADHEHAFCFITINCMVMVLLLCLCVCVGNTWESAALSFWMNDFTARLIPFSDVWIKNTEFDFWHLMAFFLLSKEKYIQHTL